MHAARVARLDARAEPTAQRQSALVNDGKLPLMIAATDAVVVREVGLRDGLQSIERILPTSHKLHWIRSAYHAGIREIEVGSSVPSRPLPRQLADTAELVISKATRCTERCAAQGFRQPSG